MYRDEPLDDEAELRSLVGDDAVDEVMAGAGPDGVAAALDAMRLLQGWVEDADAGRWLTDPQRRLGGRTPLGAIAEGDLLEVDEAVRAFIGAMA